METDALFKSILLNHLNFLFWAYALNSLLNSLFKDYSKQNNIPKINKFFPFHIHLNRVKTIFRLTSRQNINY